MDLKLVNPGVALQKNCAIIMPAYNEEAAIAGVVEEWGRVAEKIGGMLVVINDGSKDNTLQILKEAARRQKHLVVFDKANSGHASTCLKGYRWAINEKFTWIFQTDSDGQARSEDFDRAWEVRKDHDFIFGYRPSRGDGLARLVISRVLRLVIYFVFRVHVPDANVPFRLMKADRLEPQLRHVSEVIFLANALLTVVLQANAPIHWISITFQPRRGGQPSVSLPKFFKVGLKVTKEFMAVRKSLHEKIRPAN